MQAFFGQVPFSVQGGHAAGAGGRDGLAVHFVLGVSAGEHAADVGAGRAFFSNDVALLIHFQLTVEHGRVGLVTNGHEKTLHVKVAGLAAVPMLEPLPMTAIEHLARTLVEQEVPAGHDVVTQGRPGDGFYVLVRGDVDVLHDGEPVRVLSGGDAFGEVALLRDTVRTTTVRARGDTLVWKVHRQSFVAAVHSSSKSSAEAAALMARLPFVTGAEALLEHPQMG